MPLLDASDDFRRRSLAGIAGVLQQLAYVIRLRKDAGEYVHWGLSRTYGPQAAQHAVAATHSKTWIELLRTPLQELAAQMESMNPAQVTEVLTALDACSTLACPSSLRGGSIRHFNSTVLALRLLCHARGAKTAA